MAIPHAAPGVVIDVRPLGEQFSGRITTTLVKTGRLEVIRLVLPAGKVIPPHEVSGEVTIHCLEGKVEVEARGAVQVLSAGYMLYLAGGDAHAVRAVEGSSVLVTILL